MRKGFLYDYNRCVNCKSCSAACKLYNGWFESPRNVYTHNESLYPGIAVINISLACNHCRNAACLEGCPSGALSRDKQTGAVVLDEKKCIGCKYCQWNCPYDAPRFSKRKRVIEKCNLCYQSGEIPSCATACPTGALRYGTFGESLAKPSWFPGKKLDPGIEFINNIDPGSPRIFPEEKFSTKQIIPKKENLFVEWSLILFSFLAMMSVSVFISSFINGKEQGMLFLLLIAIAAIVSLFHPGKPLRSWRAFRNPVSSPLSREICLMGLFSLSGAASIFFSSTVFTWVAIFAGLLFLLSIDNVYTRPDESSALHSGQTFLTGLLMISYFCGTVPAFSFIAGVKVILSFRLLFQRPIFRLFPPEGNQKEGFNEKESSYLQTIRFLRIGFLGIATAGMLSGNGISLAVTILVFTAELLDRIIFYEDFRPENFARIIAQTYKNNQYGEKSG